MPKAHLSFSSLALSYSFLNSPANSCLTFVHHSTVQTRLPNCFNSTHKASTFNCQLSISSPFPGTSGRKDAPEKSGASFCVIFVRNRSYCAQSCFRAEKSGGRKTAAFLCHPVAVCRKYALNLHRDQAGDRRKCSLNLRRSRAKDSRKPALPPGYSRGCTAPRSRSAGRRRPRTVRYRRDRRRGIPVSRCKF